MEESGGAGLMDKNGSFWDNGDAHYLDGCDGYMGVHLCQILSHLHFKYVPFIVSNYTLIKLLTKIVVSDIEDSQYM